MLPARNTYLDAEVSSDDALTMLGPSPSCPGSAEGACLVVGQAGEGRRCSSAISKRLLLCGLHRLRTKAFVNCFRHALHFQTEQRHAHRRTGFSPFANGFVNVSARRSVAQRNSSIALFRFFQKSWLAQVTPRSRQQTAGDCSRETNTRTR